VNTLYNKVQSKFYLPTLQPPKLLFLYLFPISAKVTRCDFFVRMQRNLLHCHEQFCAAYCTV